MTEPNPGKIAILIDAENVLPSFADLIFTNAGTLGEIVAKEIYGVAAALTTWVEPVLRYAIHPNLTIKASKGKNTSDIALVIGAMELLLTHDVNTVVIASSDSDFSGLSVRLRTAGIRVVGMGTEKSNPLWRTACTDFMVLEHPAPASQRQSQPQKNPQPPKSQPCAVGSLAGAVSALATPEYTVCAAGAEPCPCMSKVAVQRQWMMVMEGMAFSPLYTMLSQRPFWPA